MESFFTSLSTWHWIILFIVLLVIEALGVGGFLIGMAVAALITAISAWLGLSWVWQCVLFGVLSLILSYIYWSKFKRFNNTRVDSGNINNRLANMVGKHGVVISVASADTVKAKFGDTLWQCSTQSPLKVDDAVEVTDYEGTILAIKLST